MDFSADYHSYQTVWTPTAVYKYVDGQLVRATNFKYTSPGPAQLLVSLAVGSDNTTDLPGLQPNSASEFPIILSVDHITVWAK
jgi:beta-glucanase (GH16 family)